MRNWEEVFKRLSVPFKPEQLKNLTEEMGKGGTPKPYAPKDVWIERLREVLGPDGFRIEFGAPQIQVTPGPKGEQIIWMITCKLTLLEEKGQYHCSHTSLGSAIVTCDEAVNMFPNGLRRARADALKSCCQLFYIGGDVAETWEQANGRGTTKSSRNNQKQGQSHGEAQNANASDTSRSEGQKKIEELQLLASGPYREGRNSSFFIPVVDTASGEETELWFYKEYTESLFQKPSRNRKANRLYDLREMWPSMNAPLKILAERSQDGRKLYFRGEPAMNG